MRKPGQAPGIDNDIDNYGTFAKKALKRDNQMPAPAPTPKPPKQVPLKQALSTFDHANDFLKPGYGQPKAKPVVKAAAKTTVKKATKGR